MFRRLIIPCLVVLMSAAPVLAISPGDDLLIAGAARTATWVSDLYINNPGSSTVLVEVFWLEREPNPTPDSRSFSVTPEETLILRDVIRNNFNMNRGEGAFRITSTGGPVTANLIAVSGSGSVNGSLGAGFEAIPSASATAAGQTTFVMGLESSATFYTNLFALAGANGVTMDLDLLDDDGSLLDTATVTLGTYEAWLSFRTDLWNTGTFEGTLRARVTAGSAAILGSKIDEISRDPTTLESEFGGGPSSSDGTYQFAVYDSLAFAAGGNLVIDDDEVTALNGTYFNFDKLDNASEPACTLIWQWGLALISPTDVEDFESGVQFTDEYPDDSTMTWTLTFTVNNNLSLEGTLEAVGANFTGDDDGCNGTFPTTTFRGGKTD